MVKVVVYFKTLVLLHASATDALSSQQHECRDYSHRKTPFANNMSITEHMNFIINTFWLLQEQ